jgi:predicted HD superfamily hydrolase involved in NAD metabolism
MHTLGVVETAVVLAARNGINVEKAALTALLHDCAKQLGRDELLQTLAEAGEKLSPDDEKFPAIWHAPAGAVQAKARYDVQDPEILDAIRYHPTGNEEPSALLQIIMAADFCEPTRDFPGVDEARELVRKDLANGLLTIIERKVEHLRTRGREPHPLSLAMLKTLQFRRQKEKNG